MHLIEEQHDTVVALHNVDVHGEVLPHIDVMVRVFLVPHVAAAFQEVLESLRLHRIDAFLYQRTRINAGRHEMLCIVNVDNILEQGRGGLEEIAFLIDSVLCIRCSVLRENTSPADFKVHHPVQAERIARVAGQDEGCHTRLPDSNVMRFPTD